MSEFTLIQINVVICYLVAGAAFYLLFDVFTLIQKVFKNPKWLIILEDTVFWLLFVFAVFTMNFNILDGEIKGYALLGLAVGAGVYYCAMRFILKRKAAKH